MTMAIMNASITTPRQPTTTDAVVSARSDSRIKLFVNHWLHLNEVSPRQAIEHIASPHTPVEITPIIRQDTHEKKTTKNRQKECCLAHPKNKDTHEKKTTKQAKRVLFGTPEEPSKKQKCD